MSEILFDRTATLIFGVKNTVVNDPGRQVTNLRMAFKIEKTSESFPNKAEIRVWNMSESSRSLAERQQLKLFFEAGYGGKNRGLFVGSGGRVLSRREGPDIITEFEYGDGETEFQNAKLDFSFNPGTSVKEVFSKLTETIGLPLGEQKGIKDETFLSGLTLSGPVRDHLDNLTERQNLEWSIQDGEVQIIPKGDTITGEDVFLTPETGLIGSPKKKDKGLEITSLLIPEIRPGRKLKLESEFLKGIYRILKVTHQGDTHGKEWYSVTEVEL